MKNAGIPNFGKARIFVCKAKSLFKFCSFKFLSAPF